LFKERSNGRLGVFITNGSLEDFFFCVKNCIFNLFLL